MLRRDSSGREWPEELGTPDVVCRQEPGLRSPALTAAFARASAWIAALRFLNAVRFDQETGWLLGIALPGREEAASVGRQHAPLLIGTLQQEVDTLALPKASEEQEAARRTSRPAGVPGAAYWNGRAKERDCRDRQP